ncbi:SDR family oxidoreductase [uncultured Microbacterium sp.]|uniref:SDR family NAD(P)-dependent oxidoreductase n=1 Tax=uncultured Microbacterium sp. TaxID=191216 RepID=UPI0028D0C968|nr:SDR family oxidoreductase [uncultured Microbacterium sp.]
MTRLTGKTALITGGTSGIGFGTAKRMIEEGAFVYVTGRNQDRIDKAVSRLGDQARGIQADATNREDMLRVAQTIRTEHGTLDIVFANAGAAFYNTIDKLTEEQIDAGLAVDIKGTIFTVQAALPLLPDNTGVIIVNTSITQDMGLPTFGVYAAAKAGLRSLVRTWMNELRDRHIRVNAISPGTTHTEVFEKDMGKEEGEAYLKRVVEEIPSGRVGQPEDIGNAVVFLASDEASFINGAELTVDGGQTQIYAGHN